MKDVNGNLVIHSHLKAYPNKKVIVQFTRYLEGNRVAIRLFTLRNENLATATINVPEYPLEDFNVIVKDYAENQGMVDTLIEGGIIEANQAGTIRQGFITAPIHPLTKKAIDKITTVN